jgi:hypothetical protein
MGFAALVPGGEVAVGDTWQWQGDLLNIQDCGDLRATFKLAELVEHEGERCARITGTMSNWPTGHAPSFRCELFFSLARGLPVSATVEYKSSARTETIRTHLEKVEPAVGEAAKDASTGNR